MKQALHFITLGVHDLEKMKLFYQNVFGWKTLKEEGGIVFFKLNGVILGLFPSEELAHDIGIKDEPIKRFKKFTLAINFRSEQEVDQAFQALKDKGIKVIKEPQHVFWGGYSGYVADLENNYWELAFNPFVEINADELVLGHL